MEPLKEMFNKAYYQKLAQALNDADKTIDPKKFLAAMLDGLEPLSLNERLRKTAQTMNRVLSPDYKKAMAVLFKVSPNMPRGYTSLVFPDYVGLYGHEHFDLSMEALKQFTSMGTSEFAIREFLKRDFKKTIAVMKKWSTDKDHHVRRLSSEGSRPRLPWSFKLDAVISNPAVTQPILEALKEDQELYVRKSVANHLNDVSKDNPDYMLQVVSTWNKAHPHTAWIVKHASRSLIKKGNASSLAVFDFEKNIKITLENFKLTPSKLKLGESLHFSFDLVSKKATGQKLVVDYLIHYRKKSGELSPKVFKLKELTLGPKQRASFSKKQVFKDFTTRKHETGTHRIEIQVNGKIYHKEEFYLKT